MEWSGKNRLKGDRLLTVTLGISREIEIWKMGKIRKIFEVCHRKKKKANLELSLRELKMALGIYINDVKSILILSCHKLP